MRELFRGSRRKVGCVTLVLACVLMGMWMRSFFVIDAILSPIGGRQQTVISLRNKITWSSWDLENHEAEYSGSAFHLAPELSQFIMEQIDARRERPSFRQWIVPYWCIVLSLTLLSAYLILGKPRKKATSNA